MVRCGSLKQNVVMKIISSKPRGQRLFKSCKIHTKDGWRRKRPFWIEPMENNLWFNTQTGEWGETGNTSVYYAMSHDGLNDAYSLKAVVRLVKKWNVPKGTKFKASLPFVGYEFIITK